MIAGFLSSYIFVLKKRGSNIQNIIKNRIQILVGYFFPGPSNRTDFEKTHGGMPIIQPHCPSADGSSGTALEENSKLLGILKRYCCSC